MPSLINSNIDDGTGEVKCVMFRFQEFEHLQSLNLGQCCLVRGILTSFRDTPQIKCESIKLVTDPNFETLWINKLLYEKKHLSGL